ncbi:putative cytochrome p450 protein [Neofusicoccum parvum UCRNP2]|uniref:Putative cytochrome p450 protein n=1 Tax=Botryosphaeria parva (strain UCR-NP2) TaxID=1287680 RepID=R1E7G2_BOTPV|nr:putative cytochrome p450 protein [Neofusicoccum parvum UCRNP2]
MALPVAHRGADVPVTTSAVVLVAAIILLPFLVWRFILRDEQPYPGIPFVDTKEEGEKTNSEAKKRYLLQAKKILHRGMAECKGKPFQIIGRNGPIVVIPTAFANEIRNDPRLSIAGQLAKDMIRKNLTQLIGGMTPELSKELNRICGEILPTSKEWQEIKFHRISPMIPAQVSAKVFLGEPLCHNKDWLEISIKYTVDSFIAARKLRVTPPFLRPILAPFMPEIKLLKKEVARARELIEPEVEKRRRARREAVAAGKPPPKAMDSLEWLDEIAGDRPFDVALGQLLLTVAATHTSVRTIVALMYDLIDNPHYIDLLREEIIAVLKEDGGWSKNSLYKMRLMDSVMKESQRLHVVAALTMNRRVMQPFTLSDGTRLPKGAIVACPTHELTEEAFWPDADKFDGHRFLRMRQQPGQETRWQFVSTSPDHLGFGHGLHSCPGRFFASNAIKITLIHMLMKWDWKIVDGRERAPQSLLQSEFSPSPDETIMIRARESEIAF